MVPAEAAASSKNGAATEYVALTVKPPSDASANESVGEGGGERAPASPASIAAAVTPGSRPASGAGAGTVLARPASMPGASRVENSSDGQISPGARSGGSGPQRILHAMTLAEGRVPLVSTSAAFKRSFSDQDMLKAPPQRTFSGEPNRFQRAANELVAAQRRLNVAHGTPDLKGRSTSRGPTSVSTFKSSSSAASSPRNSPLRQGVRNRQRADSRGSREGDAPPQPTRSEHDDMEQVEDTLRAAGILVGEVGHDFYPIDEDAETGSATTLEEEDVELISVETLPSERAKHADTLNASMARFYRASRYVVFPDQPFLMYWDITILLFVCYIIIQVPWQVGVSDGYFNSQGNLWLLSTFISCFFFADVILNFRRAYYNSKGRLVFNRRTIVLHYLRGWFLVDLISCFPVDAVYRFTPDDFIVGNTNFNLLSFINLLRVARLQRANQIFRTNERILALRLRYYGHRIEMVQLIVALMLFCHWTACMFCYVALIEATTFREQDVLDPARPNWMAHYAPPGSPFVLYGVDFQAMWSRYTVAMYWAMTTMTTIGYGDVTPVTRAEIWFVFFVELLAGLVWARTIGFVIQFWAEMQAEQLEYRGRMRQMNLLIQDFQNTAEDKDVGRSVRLFLYRQHKRSASKKDGTVMSSIMPVLESLPPRLRNSVCLGLVRENLRCVSYLRDPCIDKYTLGGIAALCQLHQYDTGEVRIMESNAPARKRGLLIVRAGVMAVTTTGMRETRFRVYTIGGTLHHDTLLCDLQGDAAPRVTTVAFLTYTEVVMVPEKVIKALFFLHPAAWRNSGRWCVLRAAMKRWARDVLAEQRRSDLKSKVKTKSMTFFEAVSLAKIAKTSNTLETEDSARKQRMVDHWSSEAVEV
jgi:hypothetical protein